MRTKLIQLSNLLAEKSSLIYIFIKTFLYKFTRNKIIMFIGDSHTNIFTNKNIKNALRGKTSTVLSVNGATARGIQNPDSKTNARKLFIRLLTLANRKSPIIIGLGEVDCGFLVWYKSKRNKTSAQSELIKSIENYKRFLLRIKIKMGFNNLIVYNVVLPSVKKYDPIIYKWSPRKNIHIGIKKRTGITQHFNKEIKKFCNMNNIKFIDLDKYLLNKKTGIINEKFVNKKTNDHHLNPELLSKILVKEFIKLNI
jgi:hypothetical protein